VASPSTCLKAPPFYINGACTKMQGAYPLTYCNICAILVSNSDTGDGPCRNTPKRCSTSGSQMTTLAWNS
jgi:hypothetical protein